jgi:hypothetical protein
MRKLSSKSRMALFIVLAAMLSIHLWSLMHFPPPFVDEAWFAGRAWSFIQTGRAFGPLDAGVFDRFEGYWTLFPWLPTFIQSLGLRFVSQPELLPLRIVSLLFGFLLLGTVYAIATRLRGPRLGLLSVFLVSVSWPFFYSAHLARYDIVTAALGFAAIALYLNNRTSRSWVGLLSGLCVGLAFEIHPHGIIYAPALVALYFLHLGCSMFRTRHFWAFVGGGGLGIALYATLHILPYPQTYLAAGRMGFANTHTPPILTLDLGIILQAVFDQALLLIRMYLVLFPVIVWALVSLARRGTEADKTLLVLNGALVGGAMLLIRNKFLYYAILFTPAIDLMLAEFLLYLFQRWHSRLWDYVKLALVLILVATTLLLNLSLIQPWTNSWQIYQKAQGYIKQTIQPGDSIMASQTYWFGLYDHVYYSWEQLIYYQRYAPGSTLEDALCEFRPDVIIIDQHLAQFISGEAGTPTYSQYLRLPQSEMEAFLSHNANPIGLFEVEHYGPIYLYRIEWQPEEPNTLCLSQEDLGDAPDHIPVGR